MRCEDALGGPSLLHQWRCEVHAHPRSQPCQTPRGLSSALEPRMVTKSQPSHFLQEPHGPRASRHASICKSPPFAQPGCPCPSARWAGRDLLPSSSPSQCHVPPTSPTRASLMAGSEASFHAVMPEQQVCPGPLAHLPFHFLLSRSPPLQSKSRHRHTRDCILNASPVPSEEAAAPPSSPVHTNEAPTPAGAWLGIAVRIRARAPS